MEALHMHVSAASASFLSTSPDSGNSVVTKHQHLLSAGKRQGIAMRGTELVAHRSPVLRPFSEHHRRQKLSCSAFAASGLGGRPGVLTPELKNALDGVVTSNKIVLFMKGDRQAPQCGFSNTVVQVLNSFNVPYETVDVLSNNMLREGLKEYSSWPTFPQVYIDGEFFGGCDIVIESFQSGELKETLERVLSS